MVDQRVFTLFLEGDLVEIEGTMERVSGTDIRYTLVVHEEGGRIWRITFKCPWGLNYETAGYDWGIEEVEPYESTHTAYRPKG